MALNDKQRVFVEEYLTTWNASEAARRANYAKPGQQGHRLLKNVEISEEIQRRVADKAMTADEVLIRLAEHARGSMGDFIQVTDNGPVLDLQSAALLGNLHLIKKLKTKTRTISINVGSEEEDESDITEVYTEFELYDAQSALVHIGKHHGLFKDVSEVKGEFDVNVDDAGECLRSRVDSIATRIREASTSGGTSTDRPGEEAS